MSIKPESTTQQPEAWRNFSGTSWKRDIDVRDFIISKVTPYDGDETFLVGPTARTSAVWKKLQPSFSEELKKGVLDVDAKTPSSLTSHGPGYIDQDNEVIVGLQTDKPFRRAIMPTGGYKMVEDGLKAAGFEIDPAVRETFTKYRKTHNDAVFDLYTPEIRACRKSSIIPACRTPTGAGASSAITGAWRCMAWIDSLRRRRRSARRSTEAGRRNK
jgi:formate C-acetyltransferase